MMESNTNTHSYFWERIQAAVGILPQHIMNILELQGYSACDALGEIQDADVTEIESDLKLLAPLKKVSLEMEQLQNLYGHFTASPENFKFLNGERKAILKIAEVVRKNGIQHFLPGTIIEPYVEHLDNETCTSAARNELVGKIKAYYSARRVNTVDFESFFSKLDDLSANVSVKGDGSAVGIITCYMCTPEKTVKLVKNFTGTWLLGNFVKHCSQYHFSLPDSKPKRKRNSSEPATSTPKKILTVMATEPGSLETTPSEDSVFDANTTKISEVEPLSDTTEEKIIGSSHGSSFFEENSSKEGKSFNEHLLNASDVPVLETLIYIHAKSKDIEPHGRRYTNSEKDIGTYEFLAAGNSHFSFHSNNATMMSTKTIQRHLKKNTINVTEGSIDIDGLKKYLIDNGFPLVVCLCEDATRITPAIQYDYTTDSLRGLVAPLDENGLPQTGLFKASSPYKVAEDIKEYPTGNYVYVQMALPLATGAAPFVLYHVCSDNKFNATDVLNRWKYTEMVLNDEGIRVIANASDGDPRLMKAMKQRACLNNDHSLSAWGWWYAVKEGDNTVLNVQDMIHAINKIRNRFMRDDLKIGNFTISTSHLKELITNHSKDKHRLCMSDIDLKDKMKFGPSLKMIDHDLINYLQEHVPQSTGTVLLLTVMRQMYRSFVEENIPPLDRVQDIWTANFIIRAWRNWCKQHDGSLKNCITTNAYMSLELDAHALISFMKYCIDNKTPEQFLISCLSSQPSEDLFRQLRSMATVEQTVVNFSIKELSEKLKRLQMKTNIMYRYNNSINFPALARHQSTRIETASLPSIEEIKISVGKALTAARLALITVGIRSDEIDFKPTMNYKSGLENFEFVDLGIIENTESDDEPGELNQETRLDVEFVSIDEQMFVAENDNVPTPEVDEIDVTNEMELITAAENHSESIDEVYDANLIFPNYNGVLNLKSTTVGNRHTFKITDSSSAIKNIKKTTLIWMLTQGHYHLSSDRMRRFSQRELRK